MSVVTTDTSPEVIEMGCADEGFAVRKFVRSSEIGEPLDYSCPHCGWMQSSEAAGAAELCRSATWQDDAEYQRYAKVAASGGFQVSGNRVPVAA